MRNGYFSAVGSSVAVFLAVCLLADHGLPQAKASCFYYDAVKCGSKLTCATLNQCSFCGGTDNVFRWTIYNQVDSVGNACVTNDDYACGWCNLVFCGAGSTFSDSQCTQPIGYYSCYVPQACK